MQRKARKSKSFYIDTNVALDFATNRDIQTVLVLERIRERGWKCVSSSLLAMEMATYRQEYTFITKAINNKMEVKNILRSLGNRNLSPSDFQEIEVWFNEFSGHFKSLALYDFILDGDDWAMAREISFNSNLSTPDVIHLTSALLGSVGGLCDVFVTKDGLLYKEAEKVVTRYRLRKKLKVMTPSEIKRRYFPR